MMLSFTWFVCGWSLADEALCLERMKSMRMRKTARLLPMPGETPAVEIGFDFFEGLAQLLGGALSLSLFEVEALKDVKKVWIDVAGGSRFMKRLQVFIDTHVVWYIVFTMLSVPQC
uniref:Uncharacterized protein n=1 Tax=Kalanchoe fedtschenkoi TaxID=63787 RepID=A0A7N0V9K7_KALFE